MTRTEFIRWYAKHTGASAPQATSGLLDVGGKGNVALPCACGEKDCQGWALVSPDEVHGHLMFKAPDDLRTAYAAAVVCSGGTGKDGA